MTHTPASQRLATLLPMPREVVGGDGVLAIPSRIGVEGRQDWADVVADLLAPGTGLRVSAEAEVLVRVVEADVEDGGYRLVVDGGGVTITASARDGVVNAVTTLRQLLPEWTNGPAPLPGAELDAPHVTISDAPKYQWRGLHLDVSRHFAPLPYLYRFVDLLVAHKFNRFHLHLNDDQGWRFEVKKYPLLTTVGAVRSETVYPHVGGDGTPQGGAYTQDQLRALNEYAKQRGVTVVPEIDVPGHARALLAAYPEFGAEGHDMPVATGPGVFEEVLHLDDHSVAMVEDIFTELLDVFDSPWIHIGGDECPSVQWENDPRTAALLETRGLDGVEFLQPWFTEHLRDFLASRGREVVGWDEIIDQGELPGVTVMSWRGTEPGQRALAAGRKVIMAPAPLVYFDYYQSNDPGEPYAQPDLATWQQVVEFDPADGVADENLHNLLGVQGQMWREFVEKETHVEYLVFPRAVALAQVGWAGPVPADEFEPRLRGHLVRLAEAGVNFRPLDGPLPWQVGGGKHHRPEGHGVK